MCPHACAQESWVSIAASMWQPQAAHDDGAVKPWAAGTRPPNSVAKWCCYNFKVADTKLQPCSQRPRGPPYQSVTRSPALAGDLLQNFTLLQCSGLDDQSASIYGTVSPSSQCGISEAWCNLFACFVLWCVLYWCGLRGAN